jgi:Lrp/AsnC family transcriptional regulator, leucine-responsive regulatory protein
MKLDETDLKILEILQNDGRITNAKLAARIGISPPAMLERVRRLESNAVIVRFVALVDRKKIGQGVLAFVSVSLAVHQPEVHRRFIDRVSELGEVLECYQVSGDSDFVLKVALKSLDQYARFINHRLAGIEGIQNIRSTFVLDTVKYHTAFPLQVEDRDVMGSVR